MIPLPSPPTDNLYKFKALGGIVIIIATAALFYTEIDNSTKEAVTLNAQIELLQLKDLISNERYENGKRQFKIDSTHYANGKNGYYAEIDSAKKAGRKPQFEFNGKTMEASEYNPALEAHYAKIVDTHNAAVSKYDSDYDDIRKDKIKLREKQNMLSRNKLFLEIIAAFTGIVLVLALRLTISGFKQWKTLQTASDELALLQVEKARLDIEKEKREILKAKEEANASTEPPVTS